MVGECCGAKELVREFVHERVVRSDGIRGDECRGDGLRSSVRFGRNGYSL